VIRRGAWCCRPATTHEVDKNTLPVGVPSDVRACSGDGDMGGLFFVQVALPPARAPAASPRVSASRTSARAHIEVAGFGPLLRVPDRCSSAGRCWRDGAAALPVRQRCQCGSAVRAAALSVRACGSACSADAGAASPAISCTPRRSRS